MTQDPHSYATPTEARVRHLTWDAIVNFNEKTIDATATWQIEVLNGDTIRLDTKDLDIASITVDDGISAEHRLGPEHPIFGRELSIFLPPGARRIQIRYSTRPGAEALQWLNARQTAGKAHPFLFTQSQAILARSWIPCQDSPGVRFTYDARVTVPNNLIALMSASNPNQRASDGIYHFRMDQPIPSYLLALAVGDLRFKPISDRSGVYAEDTILEKAAWEFADLEKMISAAEELYGPYRWDRYDVLVLPPSFPFGGMENPRLTFATPTILAGDRSLTSLIAHELAHSWSGNLVTNATWNDFWLNEGFTVYFETRIMERLYGSDYAEMLASLNLQDLHDEIASLKEKGQAKDTRLKLELEGRNPDEGVTSIAYNKGYFFLRSIEVKYGRDKFDAFLKDYFNDNAFGAMDTKSFQQYFKDYYRKKFQIHVSDTILHEWIYQEGLPRSVPRPDSERFDQVDKILAAWREGEEPEEEAAGHWSSHEWLHFLKNLPDTLSQNELRALDRFGAFTSSGNAEIFTAWGVIAIRNHYEDAMPVIETFLINTGRRKFLNPLYQELVKTAAGKQLAQSIYNRARPNYHFVATNTFDKLLQ